MQFFLNGRHQATLSDFDTEPLVRSIIISLFSWKRAGEDDVLPGKSRMGWWADSYNDDEPPIGSKLWLLSREVLTDSTLKLAREYAEDALQWLVDDHVAESVSVSAERGGVEQLNLNVAIKRPDQATLNLQFQNVWGS